MDQVADFIQAGVERVYPGQWETVGGGFGTRIEVDDVGVLIVHSDKFIHFASGLLAGVTFSEDLVRDVAEMNCGGPFGSLVLSEGQPGHWLLAYGVKIAKTWFDPASRMAPQMVLDLLGFIPDYSKSQAEELQSRHGGMKWGTVDSWWYTLLDKY
jgi:hypothetical protein